MTRLCDDIAIRAYEPADRDAVIALSLRAWEPVFTSVNGLLGDQLATALHGEDWRAHQAAEVSAALEHHDAWVAESDGHIAGFAVTRIADPDRAIGELHMLAVDPPHQRAGIGRALTDHATEVLRAAGMRVASLSTGGDPGHAPARALYEKSGYRLFPSAQYFKPL
jgi:ribosomal protein S18 acetylase RimI-like enzyme